MSSIANNSRKIRMTVFVVEYTNDEYVGNQCAQMEIEAPNLETAYEIMNAEYPDLCIDQIYPSER